MSKPNANARNQYRLFSQLHFSRDALRNSLLLVLVACAVSLFLYFPRPAAAASKFWIATGPGSFNFNVDANWSSSSGGPPNTTAPGGGDVAFFDGNGLGNCTISANASVAGINIGSGYTGTITQGAGVTLTVGSSNYSQAGGTFTGSSGDIDVNNDFTISGGIFNSTSGTLFVAGSFLNPAIGQPALGTFTHNNVGTVTLDGSLSGRAVTNTNPFNNLNFNATGSRFVGGLVVEGALALNDGSIEIISGGTVEARGAVTVGANFDGGPATLLLANGGAARTISLAAGATLPRINVNDALVTVNTTGSGTLNWRRLTFQAGTINQGDVAFVFVGDGSGVPYNQTGGTFNASSASLASNGFTMSGGAFNGGSGNIDDNDTFTISGGTFTSTTGNLSVAKSFTQSAGGTFIHNGGTVTFDGTATGGRGITNTNPFNNVSFDSPNEANFIGNLVVLGALALNDGDIRNNLLEAQGSVTIGAGFDGGNGKLSFTGAANQTFTHTAPGLLPTGVWTVNKTPGTAVTLASNLILSNGQTLTITSGTLDQSASFNLQTSALLTVSANGTLRNFGTGDLTLGGNLSNAGVVNINGGGTNCGDPAADLLLIRSTVDTTVRTWSGAGTFSIVDVDVNSQSAGSPPGTITAFGSSVLGPNMGAGWTTDLADPDDCPVEVTQHPGNQTSCPGGSAAFTVNANGTGLSFVWRKGGTPIANGGNISIVSGANTSTLTINPVSAADAGSYDMVVANSLGVTATSNPATLSVLVPPVVTGNPADTTLCEGALATFTAAASGDPVPTVQWQVSTDGTNFGDIAGATSTTLSFTTTAAQNGNKYRAVFTNTCGVATTTAATLTVNTAPVVSTNPVDTTVCEGALASFTAAANGAPIPTVQWQVSTDGTNFGDIIGATSPTHSFTASVAQNGNKYRAVFTNSCGTATTTAATLTVNTAPVVSNNPADAVLCEGALASFTAAANGDPNPTVQWQVSTDGTNFGDLTGATSLTLSFTASAAQNGNKYRAVFTNSCNTATTTAAALTVNTAPAVSTNPGDTTVCDGALASFIAAANGQPTPTVQWQVSTDGGTNFDDIVGATSTTLSFTANTSQNGNQYRAVFTNSCSNAATTGATLTVEGFALSSNQGSFPTAGGSSSVNVITGNTCTWTAVSNDSFIHITSGSPGAGNDTVNYSVDPTSSPRTGTMTIAGKTFTVNQTNPSASGAQIRGRVTTGAGEPLEGAVVQLSGSQIRKTITDGDGHYRFDNVETTGFYTVTPARVNHSFSPSSRSFSQIGNQTEAAFTASANGGNLNPLDTNEYFVRQHYVDFLGREPDEAGFNFWVNNIEVCGADIQCREVALINTSAAFFLSIEFQQTGYLVYRMHRAAYGNIPDAPVPVRRDEFRSDSQAIGRGVVVNQTGWEALLENNSQDFAADFVQRSRFLAAFPESITPAQFVDTLNRNAGDPLSQSERDRLVDDLATGAKTRAQVLRAVAEDPELNTAELNRAFVLMQYFGYLRRNPNDGPEAGLNFDGYNFWLHKLNQFNGDYVAAEMVKAFITSGEYRQRFIQ